MKYAPRNTITVYSFSKYFGCTGWRLGAIAIHEDNVFEGMIAALPEGERARLRKRYSPLTLTPDKIKFIDRLVADSRQVALNHTAGLSMPQQVMMTFFSLFDLTDAKHAYKDLTRRIVNTRLAELWKGLNLPLVDDPTRAGYYATLDLMKWAEITYGEDFMKYLVAELSSAADSICLGDVPLDRAAQWKRIRRTGLVGARLPGKPHGRGLFGDRRRSEQRGRNGREALEEREGESLDDSPR